MTLRRKSDVNGIKSFERAYARVGGATGRGGSMNKGVVAGRWWNMATGIARWQKREKEPWPRERKRRDGLRGNDKDRERGGGTDRGAK